MASTAKPSAAPAIVRLWLLRLVLRTTLVERLGEDWPDSRIFTALQLPLASAKRPNKLSERLEPELLSAESVATGDDPISQNLERLAERLNLTATERALLAFAAHSESERALAHCLRAFEDDDAGLFEALAVTLGTSADEVATGLRPDGTLRGAQLLRRERMHRTLMGPLSLAPMLGRLLRRPFQDVDDLLSKFFAPSRAATSLGIEDFPHLAPEIDIITRLLRGAGDARTTGINVLLHGPPGTGKTELALLVAKLAGAPLYEVAVADDEGNAADGCERLAGYALCQRSLRAIRRAIVLFDEIEDALPRKSFAWAGLSRETGSGKGWLNRSLEESSIPSIWIANSIDHIDPAYLRRFAFVLEVSEPPTKVRRRMLGNLLSELGVSDACLQKLAERKGLTPAHIQQARTVLKLVERRADESVERLLDRVVDGLFRPLDDSAGDHETLTARLDVGSYDLRFVNASIPLDEVVQGLVRSRRATVLLSGPPGTGKTAFVAHLQDALEMPVVAKRVSDLQSCWLGQTEKNLAAAFRQAKRESAILFLDEADSFFQSRERAVRSWEVTQVNELLTHMESFAGILVCATNFIDTFDPASMRRFDLKVRLEPLTSAQRAEMFAATLRALGATGGRDRARTGPPSSVDDDAAWRKELDRLGGLTPGDYAAAARRLRVLGVAADGGRLLAALESERRHKPDAGTKPAGFRS